MIAALSAWEVQLLLWFQNSVRNPVTDPIVSFFTHLGDHGILWIVLTLLLLIFPKTRKLGFATALGLIFSLLFTNIALKNIFQRVRPWVDFPALLPLVDEPDPNSFPSGHTSAAFAFALAAWKELPRRWMKAAVTVLAVLMGLSRLYVGVHYPTDVLCGILVGVAAGLCGWWLAKTIRARFQSKKPSVA